MVNHLNPVAARLLKRPTEVRHTYLDRDHYVKDAVAENVLATVEKILAGSVGETSPKASHDSLLVTCPRDHGKKTLVRRLKKKFASFTVEGQTLRAPILFIDAYAHGKTDTLYEDILMGVNPDLIDAGGENHLRRQLLRTLEAAETKIVVVSHAHRLLSANGKDVDRVLPVLDWLTYRVGLTLILVADPVMETTISGD